MFFLLQKDQNEKERTAGGSSTYNTSDDIYLDDQEFLEGSGRGGSEGRDTEASGSGLGPDDEDGDDDHGKYIFYLFISYFISRLWTFTQIYNFINAAKRIRLKEKFVYFGYFVFTNNIIYYMHFLIFHRRIKICSLFISSHPSGYNKTRKMWIFYSY